MAIPRSELLARVVLEIERARENLELIEKLARAVARENHAVLLALEYDLSEAISDLNADLQLLRMGKYAPG